MLDYKFYNIPENKRYASPLFFKPFLNKRKISYDVIFTVTCFYDLENIDSYGHNRLFGLSYGYTKYNSAQFVWKPTKNGTIQLYAQYYVNFKLHTRLLSEIYAHYLFTLTLKTYDDFYLFSVFDADGFIVSLNKFKRKKTILFGYETFIEFAKKEKAPKNIYIMMRHRP